jgi:hypothetical protein
MNKLKFSLCMILSALTLTGWAQQSEIKTGLVKFRYPYPYSNDYYMSKSTSYGDNIFKIATTDPVTFYIDKVGESYLIISGKPEISGEYVRGIYAFADAKKDYGFEFTHDGFDESNGYFNKGDIRNQGNLLSVHAIRKGNTLYVLGNEYVTDYSKLEELVQAGKVKKIDLTKISNFEYKFVSSDGGTYYIESEIGATLKVDDMNGQIKIQGKTVLGNIFSSFYIESQGGGGDDGGVSVWSAKTGLVKIYRYLNNHEYLGTLEERYHNWWSVEPPDYFLYDMNIAQEPNASVTFYLDSAVMQDFFLLAMDVEKIGDCIKGKYVFKSSVLYNNQWPRLCLVNAIRYGDALYVLGDETAPDFSSLENLASAGKIRKINLKEKNEFCFYVFLPYPGSERYLITTEMPIGTIGSWVGFHNGNAVIETGDIDNLGEFFGFEHLQDTLKNQSILVQPTPIGWSKGSFSLSLAVPESGTFTATFDVSLPQKFTLNESATKLATSLESGYELKITPKSDGVWSFEIKPKTTTRSASANAFREVVDVAYTVDKSLYDGKYELKVQDLNLALGDGTVIQEEEIVITVLFNSITRNETIDSEINVWLSGENLYVSAPVATTLSIYTLTGAQIKRLSVGAGVTTFDLKHLPKGVYVVRGESGWMRKVVKQ